MISLEEFKRQLVTPPNLLSLFRLILGFVMPLLIFSDSLLIHILAVGLFILGSFTDRWDGTLAREMDLVSDVGKYLDPLADKFFTLGMLAAFSCLGFFSPWWLFPIFAREIIITFCRTGWLIEGLAVGAEMLGKIKLCIQVCAVSACFIYLLALDISAAVSVCKIVMLFFVILSAGMTLLSGYTFLLSNRELLQTQFFAKYTAALGVGLSKKAPGTWGTIAVFPIIFLTHHNKLMYVITFFIIYAAGGWAIKQLNLRADEDPGFCVTDEACGMMLSLFLLPLTWQTVILGFLLFRLFDILKPFPLKRLENMHGYKGIMFDDLGAAVYTWLILSFIVIPFF